MAAIRIIFYNSNKIVKLSVKAFRAGYKPDLRRMEDTLENLKKAFAARGFDTSLIDKEVAKLDRKE